MNWKKNVAAVMGIILFSSIIACHGWAELQDGPKILKVKGLYIGMNIDDACNQISALVGKTMQFTINGNEYNVVPPVGEIPDVMFRVDEAKKVICIYLSSDVVNKIFNVMNLSAEDFAREFMKAYQIPKMEEKNPMADISYYLFDSANGYEVQIGKSKELTIVAITKKSDMKFN